MFPGFGSHSLPAKDISLGGALIKGFPDVRRKFTAILRKEKIIPTIEDRVDENGIWENFRKTASDDKEWPKKKNGRWPREIPMVRSVWKMALALLCARGSRQGAPGRERQALVQCCWLQPLDRWLSQGQRVTERAVTASNRWLSV